MKCEKSQTAAGCISIELVIFVFQYSLCASLLVCLRRFGHGRRWCCWFSRTGMRMKSKC